MRKDLSDCGGYCHGACVHFEIGVACAPDAVYEPRKVNLIPLSLEEIKQWMVETEGKGGIGRRDMMKWLIGEIDRLTSALSSSRSDERERIIALLDGVDRTETDEPPGWWETSAGAEFGAKKLAAIRSLSSTDQGEGERG